jgi:hypothetical protein
MNGIFRNSRGLGDLAKHSYMADCVKNYNLDFVAISETGKRDYSQNLLKGYPVELTFSGLLVHLVEGLVVCL